MNIKGWVKDLPNLENERRHHGCGHYVNSDNKVVYLVTGGSSSNIMEPTLSSTEILLTGSTSWIEIGKLPTALKHLRGISYYNKIIMTGGQDGNLNVYKNVLSFNITSEKWEHVGEMTEK